MRFVGQLALQNYWSHTTRGVHVTTSARHGFFRNNQNRLLFEHGKLCSLTGSNIKYLSNVGTGSAESEFRPEPSGLQLESFHVRDMYKVAVNAVEPKHMVENVLQFDKFPSILTVKDEVYTVDHNVYVVGFGKAVLGMARAVEDVLGEHIAGGILSIPRGQRTILAEKDKGDLLLTADTKIQVYEGGHSSLPEKAAHEAALAIEQLLLARQKQDLVIVLTSGGGSPLLPLPQKPITFEDLVAVTKLLVRRGASIKDLNAIRKNFERLKGGKMIDAAHPAKIITLIISDVMGDNLSMIASGPTVREQVTAHQCLEILSRFGVKQQIPPTIHAFLQQQVADEESRVRFKKPSDITTIGGPGDTKGPGKDQVQNVLVGSNAIACNAAAERARELNCLPYILTTKMGGEAKGVGAMLAKLGMFMLMCFDRKMSKQTNMLKLELDIVQHGVTKQQVNEIIKLVDKALNMERDAVIITGGATTVNLKGDGTGGRNLEVALGAAIQLQKFFNLSKPRPIADITILSADTDGEDGPNCPAAGAFINENFVIEAEMEGVSCEEYLDNNDSFGLISSVKGGSNLVVMRMTGTNVMDIQALLVRNLQRVANQPNAKQF
ncbi:hypothetical protein V1264_020692 [Littorina saxatilis]